MNLLTSLCRKVGEDKLFFSLSILICICIYSISLNSIPFGDDFVYIFKNHHILNTPHPFVFWDLTSDSYKSWPLTYSVFWVLYKFFGDHYSVYRLINLLLHISNCLLAIQLIQQYTNKKSKLLFLLLIFHPLAFENIFWIFQLKTLLATTFILIAIFYANRISTIDTHQYKRIFQAFIFFTLSLFTKSLAIFFPFYLLFTKKITIRYLLLISPFFLLSLYVGIQNIKGITASVVNTKNITNYYDKPQENQSTQDNAKTEEENLRDFFRIELKRKELSLSQKYMDYFSSYFPSFDQMDSAKDKLVQIPINFFFYLKMSLGFGKNWIVYPTMPQSDLLKVASFCFFIFLICFLIYSRFHLRISVLIMIFFIPISGVFYIPYMEYSPRADHWFYTCLFFTVIFVFLIQKYFKAENASYLLLCILLFQLISLSSRFQDTKKYFLSNILESPQSVILYEYLIEIEKEKTNYRSALLLAERLLEITKFKKPIYSNILFLTSKLEMKNRFLEYQRRYILFLAKSGLKDQLIIQLDNRDPATDDEVLSRIRRNILLFK
jgi:hypothetical protein